MSDSNSFKYSSRVAISCDVYYLHASPAVNKVQKIAVCKNSIPTIEERGKSRGEPPEVPVSRALGFLIVPRRAPYYTPRLATRHGS